MPKNKASKKNAPIKRKASPKKGRPSRKKIKIKAPLVVNKSRSRSLSESSSDDRSIISETEWKDNCLGNWNDLIDEVDNFIITQHAPHHDPVGAKDLEDCGFRDIPMTVETCLEGFKVMGRVNIPTLHVRHRNVTSLYEFYIDLMWRSQNKHTKLSGRAPKMNLHLNRLETKEVISHSYHGRDVLKDAKYEKLRLEPIGVWRSSVTPTKLVHELEKRGSVLISHYKHLEIHDGTLATDYNAKRIKTLCQWTDDNFKTYKGCLIMAMLNPEGLENLIDDITHNLPINTPITLTSLKTELRKQSKAKAKALLKKKIKKSSKHKSFHVYAQKVFTNIFAHYLRV